MRDEGALRLGRLRRSHVHAPVDEHRIDGDDLGVSQALRDLEARGGLSRRRGTDQREEAPGHARATAGSRTARAVR